ncbi:uncharacterized protein LOC110250672 [Exaiptasia diaphana]|uniref:SWIM-type domain-containing protein n=1 Tax=Exaiptasia diaphana TaxID=2652724 RepID=A0A913Y101_EXADI|nr:uncharacterized protein LOC110250672 [Exaiptasia diaphana]
MVKPDVKMGENTLFLVKCSVNASMKKDGYNVYVHLNSFSGKVVHSNCKCPGGEEGVCKHAAALLFQLLDYKQLELSEVPVKVTCTEKLQSWNVPSLCPEKRGAVLFEDLLFEKADCGRDDCGGRKRPIISGKRTNFEAAPAFATKVTKNDLKRLRSSLDDSSPLASLLDDNNCQPFDYDHYTENLPSRKKLLQKSKVINNLNAENVRKYILDHLDDKGDPLIALTQDQQEQLEANNILNKVDINESLEIERNTRGQADCPQWHEHRQARLTASNFGSVLNRRESIHPKSILVKIKSSSTNRRIPLSCKWGKDNEQSALIKYYESFDDKVEICECVGLIVNPKWPWLGASPDALAFSSEESSPYGAVEIKCPSSKINITIAEACEDKNFYLSHVNGVISLKKKHPYYYQLQGIMAICNLHWIDFVVYTVSDIHIERVYFDFELWKNTMLPKLTGFFFTYLL